MRLGSSLICTVLFTGIAHLALPPQLFSQEPDTGLTAIATDNVPDAPQPQGAAVAAEPPSQQTQAAQSQSTQQPATNPAPAQNPATPSSSSSQTPAAQTTDEKSQHEKAEEQLKAQEHQRVFGVMATFNTTRNRNALPLTPAQKFKLFFKSETDPWPFGLAAVVAGIGQADDSYPAWGQGMGGYATRYGGAY